MGKRQEEDQGRGVEPRARSIRVHFTIDGERCRESLALKPTPANLRAAERLVSQVRRAIALGEFTWREYFPDSPRVTTAADESFGHYANLYASSVAALAPATRSQYVNELKRWRARIGEARPMRSIRHSWLAAEIGKVAFPSAKMRNNSLIALRGVFNLWVADDRGRRSSPMEGITNAKPQRKRPDPFAHQEAEAILADLHAHVDPQVALYFEFAFFAGMRPEEQIALRWDRIDWRRGVGRVDIVRTFKGGEKETKTATERFVEFSERALRVLKAMRAWTGLKAHGHVFENPRTGKPWHDERSQRDHYWKPSLARCGIRYRTAYKTRATYITMAIMDGANPAWVAGNVGHSPAQLWRDYAEWIRAADGGRERKKLDEGERLRALERAELTLQGGTR